MNRIPFPIVQGIGSESRLVTIRPDRRRHLTIGKIDLYHRLGSVQSQYNNGSRPFPLDFCRFSTDTSSNMLAAPLLRTVKCHRNDVHHRRVFLCAYRKLLHATLLWEALK